MPLYSTDKPRAEARSARRPLLRWGIGLLCLQLCAAHFARAQSAKVLVDSAVLAAGGRDALLGLHSQRIVSHGENFETDQARRPGAEPVRVSSFRCVMLRDVSRGRVRYEWEREIVEPRAHSWRYTEIIDGYEGVIYGKDGLHSSEQRAVSASRIAARRKELGRGPVSVLIQALSRSSSFQRLMDQTIYGRPQYVVAFDNNGQFVIVTLDAETRLLTKVEFLEDDPMQGDTNNEVFYSDWRQVGDLKLPFERAYRVNGHILMTERVDTIENNVTLGDVEFLVPREFWPEGDWDGQRGEHSSHWVWRHIALGNPLDEEQTHVELTRLAEGVYHVTGGTHHSLLIELEDHLIVVEAPLYEERSLAVLSALAERFPTKPVRTVVNTHFHSDHAGGLRTYVAHGAAVVTSAANATYLRRAFDAAHTRVPDLLQRRPKPVAIEVVGANKKTLSDGMRVVEIYPVENSHAEDLLAVFLPAERLLFISDLFSPGSACGKQAWCRELVASIERHGLSVESIVGAHGSIAPLAELLQAAVQDTTTAMTPRRAGQDSTHVRD